VAASNRGDTGLMVAVARCASTRTNQPQFHISPIISRTDCEPKRRNWPVCSGDVHAGHIQQAIG